MIRPVILCGGAGTRLWPLSRQLFPKQLLRLVGPRSLLQDTAIRLSSKQFAPAVIVSGEAQRLFIKSQLEEAGTPPECILLEPEPRNTSSAAALAACWTESIGRDELLLLVPSDHIIMNQSALLEAIVAGREAADAGAIVTFGAEPTEPNTQYGYIEAKLDQALVGKAPFPIARFVEKPNAEEAAAYIATGRFYWNTGIFLLRAKTLLQEMREFLPQSVDAIIDAMANATTDGIFVRPKPAAFARATNISIDHGIMEKTSRGAVVPVQMDWSDVGSWDAVWKFGAKDSNGNVAQGNVFALDTRGSLLRSESGGPLVAVVGLDETAVIATKDAVFVSPMRRVSDVKNVVDLLKADNREAAITPSKIMQPWGSSEAIAETQNFRVEHVIIDPGQRLSLRTDYASAAHWVVVRGTAVITIDEKESTIAQDQSVTVPAATTAWLANTDQVRLELVEIRGGLRTTDERSSD